MHELKDCRRFGWTIIFFHLFIRVQYHKPKQSGLFSSCIFSSNVVTESASMLNISTVMTTILRVSFSPNSLSLSLSLSYHYRHSSSSSFPTPISTTPSYFSPCLKPPLLLPFWASPPTLTDPRLPTILPSSDTYPHTRTTYTNPFPSLFAVRRPSQSHDGIE